ncbi:Glyoxylase, beta-lactamase superfamily II [Actinokineospora alba]|uniref:Glyoxylase, beta-lactamase superfamily II n=1 Tax=Actinokineospora alba TaxID=504798 RepID=A0A1H0FHR4_9PSEU|nr:MBL fold metallo-hydrolase [Actinokineospora alba]TDP69489.1 glyoxylase-like metal-dependent hydrolase (beta-lactamase superfamily II) [Actinokineospora alba]SDI15604.1 Glyoxylase, beta-lactamase superfamily II [Actinokineospora alba]SDN94328.1 Glyoxylase, beta-lactamase superfamily II [Actinokineospora alba]
MVITENLTLIRFPIGQAYLWRDGDDLTLIDTGTTGSAQLIADAVTGLGLTTAAIKRIVLTHGHNDHTGGAAEVRGWHGSPVFAHRADAPIVRGEAGPPEPVLQDWERALYDEIVPTVPDAAPCPVDVELEGGEVLPFGGGAQVLSVPGHTDGSIAIFLPEHRVLFTGDTIANYEDKVILGVFNSDPDRALESLRRQAELDVDIACFGHGDPVVGDAARSLRTVSAP